MIYGFIGNIFKWFSSGIAICIVPWIKKIKLITKVYFFFLIWKLLIVSLSSSVGWEWGRLADGQKASRLIFCCLLASLLFKFVQKGQILYYAYLVILPWD